MLPEDGAWLEEESDSDDDVHTVTGSHSHPHSPHVRASEPEQVGEPTETSILQASPSGRRYGTYYHHPERRKRTDSRGM